MAHQIPIVHQLVLVTQRLDLAIVEVQPRRDLLGGQQQHRCSVDAEHLSALLQHTDQPDVMVGVQMGHVDGGQLGEHLAVAPVAVEASHLGGGALAAVEQNAGVRTTDGNSET